MGVMRFLVHPFGPFEGQMPPLQMTGFDGRTFPLQLEVYGSELACSRHAPDSGKIHVLWPTEVLGNVVLSTTSLSERPNPYVFALELARGTLCDLRNQAGTWEVAGLVFPNEFGEPYQQAHDFFCKSVLGQDELEQCSENAWQSIEMALRAGQALANGYAQQRLVFRQSRSHTLPVSLGCDTGPDAPDGAEAELFKGVFNSAIVPVQWRDVEQAEGDQQWDAFDQRVDWCIDERMFVVAGPLFDLSPEGMPGWLAGHDFASLQNKVCDFVQTAVSRYVGRVRHWELAVGVNTGGALGLSEENRLSLAARALETARHIDDEIALSLLISQPFGEYMADGNHRLSPLQFVDALARSGIGLSETHLEIELGTASDHSLPRDLLQFSRLIDQWSYLGLPLSITLAFAPGSRDESLQTALLERYVPLLMAKDAVVGIYWSCFRDGGGGRFDGCGLIREDGTERETFGRLRGYHEKYWKQQ